MRKSFALIFAAIAGVQLGVLASWKPVVAATFDQQEVDQSKFIAIAVPLTNSNAYNLLILEQISDKQPCWSEVGTSPTTVNPLLLNFDFTKICGRSTDSNGYSIRQAGQDLGVKYSLSVVKRNNELVLMGVPFDGAATAAPMPIGRSYGMGEGFTKIILEPGWRFTKRSFNGKVLGHIYLTRDVVPSTAPVLEATQVASTLPVPKPLLAASQGAVKIPVTLEGASATTATRSPAPKSSATAAISEPAPPLPQLTPAISLPGPVEIPVSLASPAAPRSITEVPLPITSTATTQPAPRSVAVTQPSSGTVEIFVPAPTVTAPPLSQPIATVADTSNRSWASSNILPVPSSKIPLGDGGESASGAATYALTSSDGSGSPPPPPLAVELLGPRFRVVVEGVEPTQIRALVPDAFRSSYQGKPVIQVGSFKERSKADEMIQIMNSNGFTAVIDSIQ